jgi:hypothetical protein
MKILYNNLVNSATITSTTENPDYLFSTALVDSRLSRVGRTIDVTSQDVKFSFSSAVDVTYIAMTAYNLTSSATVKLQANTSDSWTTPAYELTLTQFDTWCVGTFTKQTYRYWRLTIDDSTNTDGYIEIGYVFLGEALTMPGMNRAMIIPQKTNSVSSKSISGQLYGDKRLNYKSAEIKCDVIEETERQLIKTFFDYVDVITPFVLLIWEDDLDVEEPIYCNLTEELSWNKLDINGLLWSLSMKFEECF